MFKVLSYLLKGNFKKFLKLFIHWINHFLDKRRISKIFKPISKELLKNQNDYRLIIYKNFDFKNQNYRNVFEKFKSNKGGYFKRDNTIRHFYADFYEESLKDTKIENLLEIGIEYGGSLRAWSALFPESKIFGADINKDYLFEESNIKTFYTNQLDKVELNNFFNQIKDKKFDVIIDDGLHTYEANINTFEILFPLLDQKNGIYFIEDIIFKDLKKYYSYFGNKYNIKIVECLNTNENYQNCLVQIKAN
jgi:cephalosporin hydroxylase